MKIKELDLLKLIGNSISSALIFGEDEALLYSIVLSVKQKSVGYEVSEFDASESGGFSAAINELGTSSFFAEKKLVIIRNIKKTNAEEALIIARADIAKNICLLICNSNLESSNKIRKAFEDGSNIACVGVYDDDPLILQKVASDALVGYKFSRDIPKILSQRFKNNRTTLLSEVEKLKIYKMKTLEISTDDIYKLDGDPNNTIFDAVNTFFDKTSSIKMFEELESSGIAAISILNMIAKYALKLHGYTVARISEDDLRKSGVFFKQIPIITKHIRIWAPKDLLKLSEKCIELESAMRFGSDASYSMLKNLCFSICLVRVLRS